MYVQFSKPMKTRGNLEKIKLFDHEGIEVENVFFNNVHELWNNEQTQLTLIVDPARVKTGLRANEAYGRALEPNKTYTLTIEGLEDVDHQKLHPVYKKKFFVTKADSTIPATKNWKFTIPKANGNASFMAEFPEMLDYNSLLQRLVITDNHNNPIQGTVTIKNEETQWFFTPNDPWTMGWYTLYINTRLEDPAGNNPNGSFDHKIGSLKYEKEGVIEQIAFKIE